MRRTQEAGVLGYSRYSLRSNTNNWHLFYVRTTDSKIYDMMTDLCTIQTIDQEISSLVKRRDFNYIDENDIIKLHNKYFKEENGYIEVGYINNLVEDESEIGSMSNFAQLDLNILKDKWPREGNN